MFPLDVIGDARVSNNLYVGGGVIITDKVRATGDVKTGKLEADTIKMGTLRVIEGETQVAGDIKAKYKLDVTGVSNFNDQVYFNSSAQISSNLNVAGSTRLASGFTFDGTNGISMIPATASTPKIFRYGNAQNSVLLSNCAAPSQAWANHQFGGMLQIFDPNRPTDGGLLNIQSWYDVANQRAGSSIDASAGGNTGDGYLLLNYFCGRNVGICTGQNGGEVFLGKTHIGNPLNASSTHFSDAQFTVNGKIVAKSCYVTLSNWADFVFDKDYTLPNLMDVEAYYKQNKHLPNIPSEKEVIENGIDVGEMNKLLLQKVEELTILMVQQEKRIKQLENEKQH